jgi:hypothetical protein
VWQYGHTDVAGRRPGYLNTPDGLDVLRTRAANARPAMRALLMRPSRAVGTRTLPSRGGIVIRAAPFHLPAPVQREVAVAIGRRIVIAGGLDASGSSADGVFRLDSRTGTVTRLGSVPHAFHDAAGAAIGGRLFVFGGGAAASSAAVQAFDLRTHRGAVVAHLPRPLSDLASARDGNAVYVVGGYDGHRPRPEIYRTTDGRHFTLVARLPIGLRYPAVTVVDHTLVVAGGIAAGGASASVYALALPQGRVRHIADLPRGRGHAAAIPFGTTVYIVGGIDASGRTVANVMTLNAATGRVSPAAGSALVSDAATVVVGTTGFIIGGQRSGHAVADVREARPR